MERLERGGERELTRGPEWASRKRTVHHRTVGGFAEAKRRRVAESSSGEEGRVGSMSVRARLAQDSDKVFQLGSKQPTEVATVPSPMSGSHPSSCAQGGKAEVSMPLGSDVCDVVICDGVLLVSAGHLFPRASSPCSDSVTRCEYTVSQGCLLHWVNC